RERFAHRDMLPDAGRRGPCASASWSSLASSAKQTEPGAGDALQALGVEPVDALPAGLLHAHQPRALESPEMARRRRPAALEASGDLARRHGAAAQLEHEQDLPPRSVGERREHLFQVRELTLRAT